MPCGQAVDAEMFEANSEVFGCGCGIVREKEEGCSACREGVNEISGAANQVIREFGPLSIYGTRPASMKPDNEFFSSDRYLEKVNNLT